MSPRPLAKLLKVLRALADPARLKIMKILEARRMCVCEITSALGLGQPNVSHHLRIMKEAGLIEDVKNGKWVEYQLSTETLPAEVRRMLASASKILGSDDSVAAAVKKSRRADRKKLCR